MMKKLKFLFILSILFLTIGAVSAIDGNSTDIVQADSEDELKSINTTVQEISSFDNDNPNLLEISEDNSSGNDSSKKDLTVKTDSNYVVQGKDYDMYLTDSIGNGVVGKTVIINLNGKDYKKTTGQNGKFAININMAKSNVDLKVSYNGDAGYNAFSKTINVVILKAVSIEIGNSRLLTNGYLRVYLHGPQNAISNKMITIRVGNKVFKMKTNKEGFVVFKPNVSPKTYKITASYVGIEQSKMVKCIKGNVINPLKKKVPTKGGVPDVDLMPKNFVMGDGDAQYILRKSDYREVMKRDSYGLYLYGKLSKYTFFKTKLSPKTYHILKREKWNVIERKIYTKVVKKNKYNYWPKTVTVSLKGKSYTYSEVRDVQNTEYTCGPTSASVCSQVLKNFHSEKYFQKKGHVTSGINIPVLKKIIERNHCSVKYFYGDSFKKTMKKLKKGCALIVFLRNHYISVIDVSPNGKKVLVSNSYGSYNDGCRHIPTNWVSVKKLKSKFAGVGLVIKPKYKLSKNVKKQLKNYYSSMGGKWNRQNVHERIPDIGR
ncbi:MAG: hypothetical protein IKF13_03370 [Methanobrevibacter sp.]|nr:hypothetical protein [Methanobrevibacter sp.]